MFSTTTIASSTRMPMREDEREERDAVEREAVEIEHQQRQRERRRNRHRDDAGFAPAEREAR
jgi:hypothetical protein